MTYFVTGRERGRGGPSKINVFAITWIRFIGSRQNLAWIYYLTLGTTLRKNFSFSSKSKMAAAAITANYEIAHNLKSIQLRDPIFFPIPMFSRVRNAMKLSFLFYDHSNYLKMAAIWVKRLNTFSRGVTLLWELQIDVSIILLVFFGGGLSRVHYTNISNL